MERERIREQVRAALEARLGPAPAPAQALPAAAAPPALVAGWRRFDGAAHGRPRDLVTEADVMRARSTTKVLPVADGAIVTPLARETAGRLGVALVAAPAAPAGNPAPSKTAETTARARSVVLAADHGGFHLKEALKPFVLGMGFSVEDLGTASPEPVDYPDFAHRAADAVASGRAAFGIVVDGVGVGSAMCANRRRGVRAAPCSSALQAQSAREHNDANVLTLGGRHLGEDAAKAVVKAFLEASFAGGRHLARVAKIDAAPGGG
jgi:ribose 5-phosphate isomerase B